MAFTGNVAIASSIKELLVKTPTILNTTLAVANTEYTITIPQTAKRVTLKSRLGRLKVKYATGGTYVTIHNGTTYSEENLGLVTTLDIFIESTQTNDVIELIYWE